MGDRRVLANEDGLVLGIVVRRHEELLLTQGWSSPCTSLVLVNLPALSVVVASILLFDDVFTVDVDHGSVDHTNVVLSGEGSDGWCWRAGCVTGKDDTGPGGVDLVGRVADGADAVDIDSWEEN